MKTRQLFLSALCCLGLMAGAKEINPLTQAMLDGYETLLQQNPKDYLTYYERASQYYRLDEYDKALLDIKKAINYTPEKEKAQLSSEFALMADIYIQTEQYSEALTAVNQALEYDPDSYRLSYMKGNICLHLDDTAGARSAFTAMQRLNSRSSEALFGLAHVAALEGKNSEAVALLKDAEKMDPTNYLTYCRLGDIHRELDMPLDAASDYLSAFSLSSNSSRPLTSIIDLSKTDYSAVEQAIDFALQKTQNVVPLYFIQANAAQAAGKYDEADNAYRELMANVTEQEAQSFYPDLAEINLHRGDITTADLYASKALMENSNLRNNLLKAQIEIARKNYPTAQMYLKSVLGADPGHHDALMYAAETAYQQDSPATALSYLNEAIINDAEAIDALLFRGYLNANKLDNKAAALNDFKRAGSLTATTPKQTAQKAIAQVKAGQILDASSTIAPIFTASDTDAESAYLYALYCLACDKDSEAKSMLDKAVSLGFDDQFLLQYYNVPLLSVAGLK